MLELLGFVQTANIIKTKKNILPTDPDNMHLSVINNNLDNNDWLEIYKLWYQVIP